MRFKCRPAEIDFLDQAPIRLDYRIVIDSTVEEAFSALQEPQTWPRWFPGMTQASAIEEKAAGPTRTVTLNYSMNFKEEFIVWEPPFRLAYRVAAVSVPYADELVESFEIKALEQGVEIQYRIGLRVHRSLKWISGLVSKIGAHSYQRALVNLKRFLET